MGFGDIYEVIIPAKKEDHRGKRYGFVKFLSMMDVVFLATELDNIFIGS